MYDAICMQLSHDKFTPNLAIHSFNFTVFFGSILLFWCKIPQTIFSIAPDLMMALGFFILALSIRGVSYFKSLRLFTQYTEIENLIKGRVNLVYFRNG